MCSGRRFCAFSPEIAGFPKQPHSVYLVRGICPERVCSRPGSCDSLGFAWFTALSCRPAQPGLQRRMASKFRLFNAVVDVAPLAAEALPFELDEARAAGAVRISWPKSQLQELVR